VGGSLGSNFLVERKTAIWIFCVANEKEASIGQMQKSEKRKEKKSFIFRALEDN
jgi:hypothetical protein